MSDYNKQLDDLSEYLSVRIDIVSNDLKKWLYQTPNQLPSFNYFVKNCINDKGGCYDFTVRRYSTPKQVLTPIQHVEFIDRPTESKPLIRFLKHSYWMGTPFNYEQIII